ncbi:hypothetical protein [Spirosoma validum]|uniref:Uncharacterized protein n=1 Tax=Spirosoma validum TaxID=2771355 RepID=A0A927B7H5_9BACT|nr:hypothetical protein [Spirosoma validum]MBD2756693.1 hypothetical protein [Spirosoma validum]
MTHDAQLSRTFLKNGLITLVGLNLFVEALSWYMAYQAKLNFVNESGGLTNYLGLWIRNTWLPELVTVYILTQMIYLVHRWFNITPDGISRSSLARYELSFLPIMLLAFPIFNPFTQSVRYLLTAFPNYSTATYWDQYITGTYSWQMYFIYLFPVLFIGYGTLNISLLSSRLRQSGY